MIVKNSYDHYVKTLSSLYERDEARKITEMVFEDVLGLTGPALALNARVMISELKANDLAGLLLRLLKGEPVQYVLGYSFFYGLKLKVSPAVLIPRPETEELVQWIIQKEQDANQILDIGTGSGCIAIALKKNLKHSRVTAIDISAIALDVSRHNASDNQVEVEFLMTDILKSDGLNDHAEFFSLPCNVIVSNPPYIPVYEKFLLHTNVLQYEPHQALFVSDDDPLLFYRAIIKFSEQHLASRGSVYFEVHPDFAREIGDLLDSQGFSHIEIKKDISGHDRMMRGKR